MSADASARSIAGAAIRSPRRAASSDSPPASSGLSSSSSWATATGPRTTVGAPASAGCGAPSWKPCSAAIDQRGEVEPGGPERDGLRAPRRADLGGGERALLGDVDAMRRGDRHARGARAQLDREPDPGGVLELLGERGRVELEHGAVPAVVRRAGARPRQRAGVVRLAVELRVCGRSGGGAVEPGVAQVGRRGGADAAVGEHDELGGRLHEVRDAVLPDREPPLPPDGRLAVAVEAGDRAARERGEVLQRRRHRGAEPTRCTKPGVGEGLGVDALRG